MSWTNDDGFDGQEEDITCPACMSPEIDKADTNTYVCNECGLRWSEGTLDSDD